MKMIPARRGDRFGDEYLAEMMEASGGRYLSTTVDCATGEVLEVDFAGDDDLTEPQKQAVQAVLVSRGVTLPDIVWTRREK